MLRPCLDCGYRSEPREGGACPECGTAQPPSDWVIVEATLPPHVRRWFVIACLVGLGFPLLMVAVPLLFGTSTIGPGCFGLFPIVFAPLLIRQLFSRSALGIYVIRHDGVATTSLGFRTVCTAADGWRAGELRRDAHDPHRWTLEILRQDAGERPLDRFEIPIDDRVDDPRIVDAAARRALTPASASDTSAGAA